MPEMPRKRREQLPPEFPGAIHYGPEEEAAVLRVLRNKSPFRYYGPGFLNEAGQFEAEFSRFMESVPGGPWPTNSGFHVTAVNSGTGALEVALEALGVGCGDEVLVQGFMWIATISAIVRSRAIPVLVDSDDTLNMDPADLAAKITPRTRVVIPVPMLGCSARIGEIMDVVREANDGRVEEGLPPVRVLEDNAQSIGVTMPRGGGVRSISGEGCGDLDRGRISRLGTFGDVAVFSMQINKHVTAGEGGIIVTRDPALHRRIQAIHNVGFYREPGDRDWYGDTPLAWGQGRRITELQAAIARVQLAKLDGIIARMRASHDRIMEAIAKHPRIRPRGLPCPTGTGDFTTGNAGSFLVFHLVPPAGLTMDDGDIMAACREARVILQEAGLLALYLHDYEVHVYHAIPQLVEKWPVNNGCPWNCPANRFHENVSYAKGTLPGLDALLLTGLAVHVPSALDRQQEDYIRDVILETVDKVTGNWKESA